MTAATLAVLTGAVGGALIVLLGLRLHEGMRALVQSRRQAHTDSLTGLANRRRMIEDLENALAPSRPESLVLIIFDLDGFKQYNEAFGHRAGDTLLARVGRNLRAAVSPHGVAYRVGGDEFCALVTAGGDGGHTITRMATSALSERGEGFEIHASCGRVALPSEASTASQALQLADTRLYASKMRSRRPAAAQQTCDALVQVLEERSPDLREHINEVAELAHEVGQAMELSAEDLDVLVRAAELHDVGKIAVPDAILQKPGALDEAEWDFLRQHTLVGERILCAAPALGAVAEVVRATHERFDGGGYPDGVVGEDIPLPARIIAVCDAYHAMTSERPYGRSIPRDEAIVELSRCGGGQFDPAVVGAFCRVMGAQGLERETVTPLQPKHGRAA
jgi:two-component system, cell cycle response regulator